MKIKFIQMKVWSIYLFQNAAVIVYLSSISGVIGQALIKFPDTLSGNEINLSIQYGTTRLYDGAETQTISYNGNYLGPTLILRKAQDVKMRVTNLLSETTTTHWHGLHVSPANDGSPHNPIFPNSSWTPEFTIMDKAGTYWYHPHLHGSTMSQVIKGAAGLIIVRDEIEEQLVLPRSYGIDDFPLVCQFQTVNRANNQFVIDDEADNAILVNGTILGVLNLPAQVVRLRILNGSSHRLFRFGFSNNITFYQIASDGGLLDKAVSLNRMNLGPGERAEFIVNLSGKEGAKFQLMTYGNELPVGFPGGPAMMNMTQGPLDNKSSVVANIEVISPRANSITTIPAVLAANHPWTEEGATNRSIVLTAVPMMSTNNFFINNKKYDERFINFSSRLGEKEIWTITNQTMMAHPFHIHGNSFYLLSVNGSKPVDGAAGRKDVVIVPPMNGSVKLIIKYEDFADSHLPYMYHCHILSHEDAGMMGQFIVKPLTSGSDDINQSIQVAVYPVPATSDTRVNILAGGKIKRIEILNSNGRLVKVFDPDENNFSFALEDPASLYFARIFTEAGPVTVKKIIFN